MPDIFIQLVSSAAISAVLSGLVVWLTKSWISERLKSSIKNEYDQKLETHKAQLKAASDIESERLRSQLSIAATERQVKFSRLHDKRAEVIAELHGKLVQVHWDAESFVSPVESDGEPTKKEKFVTAMNAMADFYRFFEKIKIYLPVALCAALDNFVVNMRQKVMGFGLYARLDEDGLSQQSYEAKHKAWIDSSQHFHEQVPLARKALESELCGILVPE